MALMLLVDCIPIELNWQITVVAPGKCIYIFITFWAILISDILTDGKFYPIRSCGRY